MFSTHDQLHGPGNILSLQTQRIIVLLWAASAETAHAVAGPHVLGKGNISTFK